MANKPRIYSITQIAIMAALVCVLAVISVPMPYGVPVSLGTFAVFLAGAVLGAKKGTAAVAVYILLGAVGLPVFAGFTGGFAKLLGVTGGFIIGYIPCAVIVGICAEKFRRRIWAYPLGMALGTASCYVFGTAWFTIATGSDIISALAACVIPFLIGDVVKIIAATAVCVPIRDRLSKSEKA